MLRAGHTVYGISERLRLRLSCMHDCLCKCHGAMLGCSLTSSGIKVESLDSSWLEGTQWVGPGQGL